MTLRVADMPPALRNACLERGHSENDEMTPRVAVGEWAAWNLGDASWAATIIDLYAEAVQAAVE